VSLIEENEALIYRISILIILLSCQNSLSQARELVRTNPLNSTKPDALNVWNVGIRFFQRVRA